MKSKMEYIYMPSRVYSIGVDLHYMGGGGGGGGFDNV